MFQSYIKRNYIDIHDFAAYHKSSDIYVDLGPLLLTWFTINPSMDK